MRVWCNGSITDSKPVDKGPIPFTRANQNYGVSDNTIRKWIKKYEKESKSIRG